MHTYSVTHVYKWVCLCQKKENRWVCIICPHFSSTVLCVISLFCKAFLCISQRIQFRISAFPRVLPFPKITSKREYVCVYLCCCATWSRFLLFFDFINLNFFVWELLCSFERTIITAIMPFCGRQRHNDLNFLCKNFFLFFEGSKVFLALLLAIHWLSV